MGRLLGIDYGSKRVGLALSDPTHLIASPFETVILKSLRHLFRELKRIIYENDVETVVVGIPYGMKGQETNQTEIVREFAEELRQMGLQVEEEDERLSSTSAEKALVEQEIKPTLNKELVDQTAAAIILQQYLDRKNHGEIR